jgi:hypothetical protein
MWDASAARCVTCIGADTGKTSPNQWAGVDDIQADDQKVKGFGIELATKMIQSIMEKTDLLGFHICTLNLEKSVHTVLENLGWAGHHSEITNKLISVGIVTKKSRKRAYSSTSILNFQAGQV